MSASMYKVEGRLHQVNGGKELILPEPQKKIEAEERLICKDEPLLQGYDDINEKEVQKQSKKETCFIDSVPKRKRRNRSHFTQRQLQYLDKVFSRQQYLTRDERTLLARAWT
ncbi:hypothetical protein OS493_024168 [Desmophyllum pertusum]|uniref:Homeobox domain-containing protein n=1 Tax=Desmophyllum pertusum TaxID=174260 RepID=A0A9W9ZBB6_9CNID|nr:hypothetical protein OS493_024168 [Desmophyllum pertusum]